MKEEGDVEEEAAGKGCYHREVAWKVGGEGGLKEAGMLFLL